MQSRRVARELALLSISQLPTKPEKLQAQQLQSILLAAIRTLTSEIQETLESAAAELERGNDRLLSSQTRAIDLNSARAMVQDAIDQTRTAINRLGVAVEFPEFIQLTNQKDVRDFALELLRSVHEHREEVDQMIDRSMVNWQLSRLARIDQDILRIAVTEMVYIGTPVQTAINEAVELAKRYSNEDGYSFINGVLRRVTDELKKTQSIGS